MDLSILYYLFLLLLFGYFMLFHFQSMTLIHPGPASSSPSSTNLDPGSINKLVEEVDLNSFYHHPLWPQRWSHPDFTDLRSRTWAASWRQQKERTTTRFLYPPTTSKFPWGYIIYRTVYTPESDELWPIAMERLGQIIDSTIDGDLHYAIRFKRHEHPGFNREPERLVKESHKDVIFSDKRFWDGAGIEQICQHFREYLHASKGQTSPRFKACLVIDDFCMKSIVASSVPQTRIDKNEPAGGPCLGVVGMIDGRFPESRHDPRYTGFMRVRIICLWHLYNGLDFNSMDEVSPFARLPSDPKALIPVYDGGRGGAQDEEGHIYEILTSRPTRTLRSTLRSE